MSTQTGPTRSLSQRLAFYILQKLAKQDKVFSPRRRERFQRSANKRNPNLTEAGLYSNWLEPDWYASVHGLDDSKDANAHFADVGLTACYAPHSSLAANDGITLTHWGAELLVRSGIMIGKSGVRLLAPDDPTGLNPFSIRNKTQKRIAVVTGIFGDFDRLLPIDPAWTHDADFFLFSDYVFDELGVWQPVHCNYDHYDPRRRARFVKVSLPTYFSDYDWVIWVDGNVLVCADPVVVVDTLDAQQVDFASFKHPDRTTVVAEAEACLRFGKDDIGSLGNHLKRNFPKGGVDEPLLFETMVCAMRPGNREVQQMCASWWEKIMNGSKRDQLSLPLAVFETPQLRYGFLPDSIIKSAWFVKVSHKNL